MPTEREIACQAYESAKCHGGDMLGNSNEPSDAFQCTNEEFGCDMPPYDDPWIKLKFIVTVIVLLAAVVAWVLQ